VVGLVKQNFQKNKKLYNQIEKKLKNKLEINCLITQVGSTAIPNMYGKNIIDILIGVKDDIEFKKITTKLINIGYFGSKNNKDGIYNFFSSIETETGSGDIHIHLVIRETERYNEFIILKNYLLCNELEAKNYSNFKKEILKKGIKDRKEYKIIKTEYVSNLISRAKKFNDSHVI